MLTSIFSKYSHFNQETYQGISIIRRWSFISCFSELKFTLTIKQASTFIQFFQHQVSSSTLLGKYAQGTCLVRCIKSIFSIPHPCNPCPAKHLIKQQWRMIYKKICSMKFMCSVRKLILNAAIYLFL